MSKNQKINIIVSHCARHLGENLKKYKDLNLIFVEKNKDNKNFFPNDEVYAKIRQVNKLRGRVVILHSGYPDPSSGLIELEMILDILSQNKKITKEIFFSYFPYGRQDKVFNTGETNYAQSIVRKFINYFDVKEIYIIDAHFQDTPWSKKYPICYCSALDLLKEKINKKDLDCIFLTPDEGAQRRTRCKGLQKDRKNSCSVKIKDKNYLKKIIKNNNIAVIDDMIETGTTLEKFYHFCKKFGAKNVYAIITHGVLKKGILKIQSKYDDLYITNTINNPKIKSIDISSLIYKNILKKLS